MPGEKRFNPVDDDSENVRMGDETEGTSEMSPDDWKRLAQLQRMAERSRRAEKPPEETRVGAGPEKEQPIDAEPFDSERAKTAITAALEASVKQYGAHFAVENNAGGEETRMFGTDEIGKRIQELTVAAEYIKSGKAAEVVADTKLMHQVSRHITPSANRALRKLAAAGK